jgi:DNA-binding MarR family transcriptional regulator
MVTAMTDRNDVGVRAWRAMLLAYDAAMRAIDAELARAESIPLSWYDVLLELRAAPEGRLQMQELSRRVVLSRTRVSRLVDDMAAAGLVDKVRDGADRRVVWATITTEGRAAFRATAPLYLRGIEDHFAAHLTDEEKAVVATALTKVTAAHAEPLSISPAPVPAQKEASR